MLSNELISLRAPEPEDLEVLYLMENDASLWLASCNVVPYSRFQLRKYIEESAHDVYTDRQVRFMIEMKGDGAVAGGSMVAGSIDLTDIDLLNGRAEVGIALRPEFRGRGIAAQALTLLEEYAASFLGLNQLFVLAPESNIHSIKLFSSAGFTVSGTLKDWLRTEQKYENVVVMQFFLKKNA